MTIMKIYTKNIMKKVKKMLLNVNTKYIYKRLNKLNESGEFRKYPSIFLRNSCRVRVNKDDYLTEDEFFISSPYMNLPREIYLYGKKLTKSNDENNIYINYWLDIFLKTIEKGYICPKQFKKSTNHYELAIGIPFQYRRMAFSATRWTRSNIVEFLSCLFGTKLQEANYQQQDLLELMVA